MKIYNNALVTKVETINFFMSFNRKLQFTEMKSFSKNIEQNIQDFKGKLVVEEFKAKVY
jgi:hypothetical protein